MFTTGIVLTPAITGMTIVDFQKPNIRHSGAWLCSLEIPMDKNVVGVEIVGNDKDATSLQIVIVDHLRAIGLSIPGRKYLDTEVRLHREWLVQSAPSLQVGVTIPD